MDTIAYLIYGNRRDYQLELTYSVASARRFADAGRTAARIVLITDEANRRPDLPIEHLVFGPDEFAAWTQDGHYLHAAKVHALKKAIDRFGGKTALIDTDTFFRADPSLLFERIGPGRTVMHAREGPLRHFPDWQALLAEVRTPLLGYRVDADAAMLNSGVVGLAATDAGLLDDVLALMPALHAIRPLFNIEQFAFSAVLGQRTTLTDCPALIAHYWGPERRFMHAQIGARFPDFSRARFDAFVASFVTLGYPPKRTIDQLRARWKGWQRQLGGDYRFAYLAYRSALAAARRDVVDANAWALVALDVLRRGPFPPVLLVRDFERFGPAGKCRWMAPETRTAWNAFWADRPAG
jgi:hypothetical protein